MSVHRLIILIILCILPHVNFAQVQEVHDAEFGIIPDSLYALEAPDDDPDASYLITNKEVDVSFREADNSIRAVLEHHIRVKVFDPTDPEASIIAIPYYFDNDMEQVTDIQGVTYRPNGERVVLQGEDIRTININSRYNVKEFVMPSVEEGAILEYRYVIERRYIEELPDFYLSHSVPTARAKMTITYPNYLRYQTLVENYPDNIHHDFVFTDTSSVPKIFTIPQPDPIMMERWIATDIPSVKKDPYISSLDDYRAKIKFLLSEFGKPRQKLENSWRIVVANMRRNVNPWAVAEQNVQAHSIGDSIAQTGRSVAKEAIQDSIFRYLNKKASFSGDYRSYSTITAEEVLSGDPADQAAINQTLLAMLRAADIEADPVLISTRESGKINQDFPSFYQFNAQMIRSEIDGKVFYMDAAFPHSRLNLIPIQMLTNTGLLLKQDTFEWVTPEPQNSIFDIQVNIDANLASNGTLSGTVSTNQTGYPARQVRQQKADGVSDTEILRGTLFDGYSEIDTKNVRITGINNYDQSIEIKGDFEIPNYAQEFSDGLEFRPMVVGYRMENPFEDEKRTLPVTLDAPEQLDVTYNISLPSGFAPETGRGSRKVGLEGATLEESYDLQSNQLNYAFEIDIDEHEFSLELFPRLYDLYERWVELSNTRWLIRN